jgi:hypothetical protein
MPESLENDTKEAIAMPESLEQKRKRLRKIIAKEPGHKGSA